MIIGHEKNAPAQYTPLPDKRILRCLLSPYLNEGLTQLAAGTTTMESGCTSEKHSHEEGELFFVINGSGKFVENGEEAEFTRGTAIFSPPMNTHQMINDSEGELKVLWVLIPPGREKAIIDNAKQFKGEQDL